MMDDYDNSFIINEVEKVLSKNSTLLEIGMGTGKDLIELAKNYQVIGTDFSPIFVSDFQKNNFQIQVKILDAITMNIENNFDCIYSNKVLHHLKVDQFIESLNNQAKHLNENGIIFMSLWHDKHHEELMFDNTLRFIYYTEKDLKKIIPDCLKIKKVIFYSEFEKNDSIIIILEKKKI